MNSQYIINWSIGLFWLFIGIIGFYLIVKYLLKKEKEVKLEKPVGQWGR